jgi:hypothetical protein
VCDKDLQLFIDRITCICARWRRNCGRSRKKHGSG